MQPNITTFPTLIAFDAYHELKALEVFKDYPVSIDVDACLACAIGELKEVYDNVYNTPSVEYGITMYVEEGYPYCEKIIRNALTSTLVRITILLDTKLQEMGVYDYHKLDYSYYDRTTTSILLLRDGVL